MGSSLSLHLQVPPEKVFGPSKLTPSTCSEGTWRPRVCLITGLALSFPWTGGLKFQLALVGEGQELVKEAGDQATLELASRDG